MWLFVIDSSVVLSWLDWCVPPGLNYVLNRLDKVGWSDIFTRLIFLRNYFVNMSFWNKLFFFFLLRRGNTLRVLHLSTNLPNTVLHSRFLYIIKIGLIKPAVPLTYLSYCVWTVNCITPLYYLLTPTKLLLLKAQFVGFNGL